METVFSEQCSFYLKEAFQCWFMWHCEHVSAYRGWIFMSSGIKSNFRCMYVWKDKIEKS